jgi:integrase
VREIAAILSQLEEPCRSAVFIAASTGFRSSELRGLKWKDVDYDGLAIHLQRGYVRRHVGEMKTESSKRRVPIAAELAASLLRLQQQTPYNQPNDWVFASLKTWGRSPIWLSTLMDNHVQPAVMRAKVQKHVTWHVFRHTFATLLKANGEDIKTLQESLRHSTVRISMETYAQAVPQNIRAAHGRLVDQIVAASHEEGGAPVH